jgi:hypothetical protein
LGLLVLLLLGVGLAGVLTFAGPWLEANWSLTFPTPLPWSWWLVFPLIPLAVLLLYFLKLRRRPVQVPSTFLWKKSIEDLHVNSLFQWLRRNLLLLLQLLGLLLLGYALAGPTYNSQARGRSIVFMLDHSASMAAREADGSRLELARRLAHERVDQLDPSDQAMVIAFSDEARTVQSYTSDKAALHAAIDRIEQTHRPTSIAQALALVEGQANPRQSGVDFTLAQAPAGEMAPRATESVAGVPTEVLLFSDGRIPELADFQLGNLRLRLERVGAAVANVGIVRLALVRDEETPGQFELSVQLGNFGDEPVRDRLAVQVEVFGRDGRLDLLLQNADLAPRKVQEIPGKSDEPPRRQEVPGAQVPRPVSVFSFADPGQGYVRVSLRDRQTGGPWTDAFAPDDVAWLAITPVRRARVLHIGEENDILEAALKAAVRQQRAVVTRLSPSAIPSDPLYRLAVEVDQFDLVIFDRCAPPSLETMPQANTLFFGQVPPLGPLGAQLWSSMPVVEQLYVREFLYSHPLFRGIETLQGLSIAQARVLPREVLPARSSALMETQHEPVAWILGRDRFSDVVFTFPLVVAEGGSRNVWNTNWPRQPPGTLPLFLDNVVVQLGRYKEYEEAIQPGQVKPLDLSVPVRSVRVQRRDPPDSRIEEVRQIPGRDFVFGNTDLVGLYEASWGENDRYLFAVNLCDPRESMIEPRDSLRVGEETVTAQQQPILRRRELWPWLVLAGLGVLLLEWFFYLRRIAV